MSETRTLPKRFYETATIERRGGALFVLLDGRALKTPGRRDLAVPREAIAEVIATEWNAQGPHIDPGSMPVTRIANTVIDGVVDDPGAVLSELKRYAETDLLYYRAEAPERLVERQRENWDPVLRWAEAHIGALFAVAPGVMHVAQPDRTLTAFADRLDREDDPFVLAGLHQMTTLTGSSILALAILENHLGLDEAWRLAHLDEDWNIEQWGSDEEAARRRDWRLADMRAAALLAAR